MLVAARALVAAQPSPGAHSPTTSLIAMSLEIHEPPLFIVFIVFKRFE